MWLAYAFTGPLLWAVSTHIDKYLVDKYFRDSDTAVLIVFTALLGLAALPVIWLLEPKVLAVPRYRKQFTALLRRNPGAVVGVNAANELINLGGGLGVRYASLLAPVALVSAISATSTFFVFLFGILLTLFFPQVGRENLSRGSLVRKAAGGLLIMAGVVLIETR